MDMDHGGYGSVMDGTPPNAEEEEEEEETQIYPKAMPYLKAS